MSSSDAETEYAYPIYNDNLLNISLTSSNASVKAEMWEDVDVDEEAEEMNWAPDLDFDDDFQEIGSDQVSSTSDR